MLANKLRKLERFHEKKLTTHQRIKEIKRRTRIRRIYLLGITKTKYIPVQIKQLNKQFDNCYTHTSVKLNKTKSLPLTCQVLLFVIK